MRLPGSPPIRVAVVGLGWVGTNRHLPWLRRTPGIEVVGGIDHHGSTPEALRRRYPSLRWGLPGADWLRDVDAVTIATDPHSHSQLAIEHMTAGRHVLTEKPMALSVAEAAAMTDAANTNGVSLGVVHNFQFARSVVRTKRLLVSGMLGDLRGIWGMQLSNPTRRLPRWYETLPLGLFDDESPHFFYLLRTFLGSEVRVGRTLIERAPGRATPAAVEIDIDDGSAPGKLLMRFDAPVSEWHLMVIGSQRLAIVDIFRDVVVVINNDGEHRARQILRSSFDAIRTHALGVITSGTLLGRGRLSYGNDEVFRRFSAHIRDGLPIDGIGAQDGGAVVRMQAAVREHLT